MLPVERHNKILQLIARDGSVEVNALAALLGVTPVTIRRDLDKLADEALLNRTHGGATRRPSQQLASDPPYREKQGEHIEEKKRIGQEAASRLKDGEAILVDSGSTTMHMIQSLDPSRHFTIVTNDLPIALEVAQMGHHDILLIGGNVRSGIYSTWGTFAEQTIEQINVDRFFMAADAVNIERGIMNATPSEVKIKQLMMATAAETILLVDHSKFTKVALARVCDLTSISEVISDDQLDEDLAQGMLETGIKLTLARTNHANINE